MRTVYETTLPRAALGLAAGAVAGAILVALWAALDGRDLQSLSQYGVRDALFVFVPALLVWGVGLLLVATLPWLVLHRRQMRSPLVAVVFGTVITFLAVVAITTRGFGLFDVGGFSAADSGGPTWIDGRLTAHGWAEALKAALVLCPLGAMVALVVWRTAYRRSPAA
jgi:hypothetical protein